MKRILVLLALLSVVAVPAALLGRANHAAAATTVLVGDPTPGDDGVFPWVCGSAGNPCDTIQHGVDHASAGDIVSVASGTYVEQVDIGKQLTLSGAGIGSTIIKSPASLVTQFTTSGPNKPVVWVHGVTGGLITQLTVDGDGQGNANNRMEGIAFYNAGGTVDNAEVKSVRETPLSGTQHGVAIYANNADATARSLSITNNAISDYQKNGMALSGDGLTVTVSGNTVTGAGTTPLIAQNGIQVGFGANGSITGNTVSGNVCTHTPGDCLLDPATDPNADGAAGILVYLPGTSTVSVQNNVLTSNQFGVWTVGATSISVKQNTISGSGGNGIAVFDCDVSCGAAPATGTTGLITGNTISGQTYGLLVRDFDAGAPFPSVAAHQNSITGSTLFGAWADTAFNGTDNWWGSTNGPVNAANTFNQGAQGDVASANVTFVPWLNAAPPTGVSFAPVTTTSPAGSYSSIQAGVSASASGGTVNAKAGTYTENVTIATPLTLAGAGQASTIVRPALSKPTCSGGDGGSICSPSLNASNVIFVQANTVTVHDLTVDGDNPMLTSGIVAGGADLDARNGIITNHSLGLFNNLTVHHVTVKNIFLRGVYASSGGSFNFHDDTVQNVQADPASIAMFNFGGAGSFTNNTVSGANDAISSNHSSGVQFLNNVVTASASGIHTDNAGDGGGSADLIQGNSVTNSTTDGYGIWVFVPYIAPTITQNTVTNVDVGLAAFGQGAAVSTIFSDNVIDGANKPGSTGMYVTTDQLGFGNANSSVTLTGNIIKNNAFSASPTPHGGNGIEVVADSGRTTTVNATHNAIFGNTDAGVTTSGAGTLALPMTTNWWGDAGGPAHVGNPGGTGNSVGTGVVYSPWLGIGTDASPTIGFQLVSPMTWIAGPAVCGATCIQAAIDDAANGDTVKAKSGVFNEHVTVNKSIILTAGSNPIIDGGGSGDGITVTVSNVTVSSFEVRNVTNGIVVAGGANNAAVKTNNIHNFASAAIRGSSATGADIATNTINGGHVASCVGGFWGIIVNSVSGNIHDNAVTGIGNSLTSGCQEGRGIEADGAATVQVTNNNVTAYQKSGIIIRDTVNSTITGNTTSTNGPSSVIAANGVTITSSGTTSITGNHTSGHAYTPPIVANEDYSCGIYLFHTTGSIIGNDSTQDEVGVCAVGGNGSQVKNNIITKHRQQGVLVDGALNITVSVNTIDGQGSGTTANSGTSPDTDLRYYGIFAVDSTGTLSNNIIKGITHGVSNGTQSGVGIRLTARSGAGSSNMTISGNQISNVQKNGMVITNTYGGASVSANVTNNTVTGNGPIAYIAQNGIQLSSGASGMLSGNTVSGYDYTPSTVAAVALLIIDAGPTSLTNNIVSASMEGAYLINTNNAVVTGNSFATIRDTSLIADDSSNGTYSGNTSLGTPTSYGMYIVDGATNNAVSNNAFRNGDHGVVVDYSGSGSPTGNTFHLNCIAGNVTDGMATAGTQVGGVINAENNWWGRVDGPTPPGHGDALASNSTIDALPFLTAPVAGCPVPLDGDGDGFNDPVDNCPTVYNPTQANHNTEPVPLPKPFPSFDDSTNPIADNVGDACDNDIDHDGIPNATETLIGTSPFVSDTDGDRTNDGTEIACGSDPLNKLSNLSGPDSDGDGLPDACEAVYGTNPAVVDTDGDLVLDGVEVRYWMTNPLVKNTDGDNCTDNREIASVNDDRKVNSADQLLVAKLFGAITPEFGDLDTNGDGKLNSADLLNLAKSYGPCTAS